MALGASTRTRARVRQFDPFLDHLASFAVDVLDAGTRRQKTGAVTGEACRPARLHQTVGARRIGAGA